MRFNTIVYCFRQGLISLKRNRLFSVASIVTIAACIFMLGIFYSIIANVQATARNAEETIGVTVFFDEELPEDQIAAIGNDIRQRQEVSYVVYISPEEAWENFSKKYFQGAEELAEGFADDNPLANSASYEIHLEDVSKQSELVKYLESVDGIRKINYSALAAGGLEGINRLIGYISAALVSILLIVSLLLISNTITLTYTVRKEEVEITKWIGATNGFVRAPFIIEGVLLGLIGSVLPLLLLYGLYIFAVSAIGAQFSMLSEVLVLLAPNVIFSKLVPISLLLGVGIGFIGSSVTIQKHLKV